MGGPSPPAHCGRCHSWAHGAGLRRQAERAMESKLGRVLVSSVPSWSLLNPSHQALALTMECHREPCKPCKPHVAAYSCGVSKNDKKPVETTAALPSLFPVEEHFPCVFSWVSSSTEPLSWGAWATPPSLVRCPG